jgi:methylated-DNA-[protein]-cysteine S-methyltransferase
MSESTRSEATTHEKTTRQTGMSHLVVSSPIGALTLRAEDGALVAIDFGAAAETGTAGETGAAAEAGATTGVRSGVRTTAPDPVLWDAAEQLASYFAGELREFTLPLRPSGTPFELEVWDGLRRIPYGETISYSVLAGRVDRPGAARAVGRANGRNPLPIVVPCHRVIGADGTLTGYAGGLSVKRALLDLESRGRERPS